MTNSSSLLNQVKHSYQELHADAAEMLAARVELAQLELRLSTQRATRLLILVGICLIVAAAGFVMLVHLAAEYVPALFGLSQTATVGLIGGLMLLLGLGIAGLSIRHFWRKTRHFERTIEELRTDIVAFSAWLQREKSDG